MEPTRPAPEVDRAAVAACVTALLADAPWTASTRGGVHNLARYWASQRPDDWEPTFQAAWARALAPLRESEAVIPELSATEWALMEEFVMSLLVRALAWTT